MREEDVFSKNVNSYNKNLFMDEESYQQDFDNRILEQSFVSKQEKIIQPLDRDRQQDPTSFDDTLLAIESIAKRRIFVFDNDEDREAYDDIVGGFDTVVDLNPEDIKPETILPTPDQTHAPTAHRFRTRRLRQGAVGEFVRGLQNDYATKQLIGAFTNQRENLAATNKSEDTIHRTLTPFLAGIMSQPELRRTFMDAVDQTALAESADLKGVARENGGLNVDVVIVGAGVQSAVAASRLRADNPELSILVVDKKDHLGGQFRSYGTRPTFKINSRAHRPQLNADKNMALPGGTGNLNPLSKASVLQLPDVTSDTYPTNLELGDTAAINLFFAAPAMLEVEVTSQAKVSDTSEKLTVRDSMTDEEYSITAQAVMVLTGAGERVEERVSDKVWTAEELLKHFGDEGEKFPMKTFAGKNIAIIGGGDTGRIVAELFTRLGPKEAYGNSVAQLGGPESITWFGVKFGSREEFCTKNRSRYEQLQAFIANPDEPLDDARVIRPIQQYASDIQPVESGAIKITDSATDNRFFDYVVDARNLVQQTFKIEDASAVQSPETMALSGIGAAIVGKRIKGSNVIFGGPAANIKLTPTELDSFPKTIRENTVAIWANAPRVDVMSARLASELTPARQ